MTRLGRIIRGAIEGARAELPAGHSGFENVTGSIDGLMSWGLKSNAGTRVSQESILQLSAVWACTSRTSQLVASLPGDLKRKGADGSRETIDDQLAEVLKIKPNSGQTALEYWDGTVAQMLVNGNAVSERLEIGRRLVGLRPLPTCTPKLKNGEVIYPVRDRGKTEILPASKVFHLRGFGTGNGLGLSAVRYGVQSLGAALAADETASSIFANGMQPGGMITWEKGAAPSPEQLSKLKALITAFTGSKKTGKVLQLPPGAGYDALSINPEDAQLLETRRFSIEDICRWFGVPPVVIGHSADGQTMWGSGVEAIMLAWLTLGINPLLRRIEARIRADLIDPTRRRNTYFEFNREAMLQMDSISKGQFMSMMGASGTMTANERRDKLNLPRSTDPNADRLLAQTALAPLEYLGNNLKEVSK